MFLDDNTLKTLDHLGVTLAWLLVRLIEQTRPLECLDGSVDL